MSAPVVPLGLAFERPEPAVADVCAAAIGHGLVLLHAPAARGQSRAARLALVCRAAAAVPAFLPVTAVPAPLAAFGARLGGDAARLAPALAAVRGCAEVLVTLEDRAPDAPPRARRAAPQGRGWLHERLSRLQAGDRCAAALAADLGALAADLGGAVAAHRLMGFALPGGGRGADLALLVPHADAEALRARLAARVWPAGRAARVTGPWPCFSFAPQLPAREAA